MVYMFEISTASGHWGAALIRGRHLFETRSRKIQHCVLFLLCPSVEMVYMFEISTASGHWGAALIRGRRLIE